ncbi:MAG TPA: hypothetical protein VH475_03095, partial [Tepidisphaeraceae bacterium]
MRLPRVLTAVALAAAMATPLIPASRALADAPEIGAKPTAPQPAGNAGTAAPAGNTAAPTPTATPTAAQPNPDAPPPLTPIPQANPVRAAAEDYWHFAKTAKYDLAVQAGQKVLDSGASPAETLQAFQAVAADRRDDLFETMFRWLNVDPMKDVTQKLIGKLKEGQTGMVTDPKWIMQQVQRLSVNER